MRRIPAMRPPRRAGGCGRAFPAAWPAAPGGRSSPGAPGRRSGPLAKADALKQHGEEIRRPLRDPPRSCSFAQLRGREVSAGGVLTRVDGSTPAPRAYLPGVAVLLALTALVAVLASPERIGQRPGVFRALLAGGLILALGRIDVFGPGRLSPGAIPSSALAMLLGPLGPIAAEPLLAMVRGARRFPP